jgi:alpha-beta hydrolase superfamily lysophospholipase
VLYAKSGDRRDRVTRLILNSPFLELPQGSAIAHLGAFVGRLAPFVRINNPVNPWYAKSLHAKTDDCHDCKGEWHFNKNWKPLDGSDAYYGWIRAVVRVQDRIKKGLDLQQPVLVMHSDSRRRARPGVKRFTGRTSSSTFNTSSA